MPIDTVDKEHFTGGKTEGGITSSYETDDGVKLKVAYSFMGSIYDDAERNAAIAAMGQDTLTMGPKTQEFQNKFDSYTDDKVTVLTYYFHNRETGTIWCMESCEKGVIRDAYDTGYTLYPLIWINWDYVRDCYHGQAMVTGLLPNQKFINKMFAMVSISMLTTAFPKIIYDRNRSVRHCCFQC